MTTGEKIRILRSLRGFTQSNIATELAMKATTHIARWELGESIPRTRMLQRLGRVLDVHWPWLQDSSMPFSKNHSIYYRPLSPYYQFTSRWITSASKEIPQLLPTLLSELEICDICSFTADCGGGFIACRKQGLTIFIISQDVMHKKIVKQLPEHPQEPISDVDFLNMLLFERLSPELCAKYDQEDLPIPEPKVAKKARELLITGRAILQDDADIQLIDSSLHVEIDIALKSIFNKYNINGLNFRVSVSKEDKPTDYYDIILDPDVKLLAAELKENLTPANC